MGNSSHAKRLRNLVDQIPDDTVIRGVLQHHADMEDQNGDHLVAMLGASYLDHALGVALQVSMRSLTESERKGLFDFEKNGPLAEFSAKIKLAHALNIIGPMTLADLNHMRKIRNAFAHSSWPINFSTQEIIDICGLLKAPDRLTILGQWAWSGSSKARYVNTAISLAKDLKSGIKTQLIFHKGRAISVRVLP